MPLIDAFFARIVICGLLIALTAGPIGCLLIWRRMAFFGDAVAHSSLLGVALGSMLGIDTRLSVLSLSLLLALLLGLARNQSVLSFDTRLVLFSHGVLAMGLIALSFFPHIQSHLNNYLFGDLLALSEGDLINIIALTLFCLIVLYKCWRSFVTLIVSPDIAFIEGQNTLFVRLLFFTLIGAFVAVTAKAIGVILMTALLIIPAAAARTLSKSPLQMMVIASAMSAFSLLLGFYFSYQYDLPVTATIVMCGFGCFCLTSLWPKR